MSKELGQVELKELLKEHGFKITPSRLSILSILKGRHVPLSAEDIFKDLKGKKTDYATVYRTLTSFERSGVLKRVDLHRDSVYFELNDDHHHHMVCTDCGLVEDFEDCDVDGLTKKVLARSKNFKRIAQHSLEMFGVCKTCSKV